ncbi:MAG: hypothetical protein AB8H79_24835 [Myxococcota bacterium]
MSDASSSWFVIGWTGPMMALFPAPPRPFEVVHDGQADYAEAKGKGGDWEISAGPFSDRAAAEQDANRRREAERVRHERESQPR